MNEGYHAVKVSAETINQKKQYYEFPGDVSLQSGENRLNTFVLLLSSIVDEILTNSINSFMLTSDK